MISSSDKLGISKSLTRNGYSSIRGSGDKGSVTGDTALLSDPDDSGDKESVTGVAPSSCSSGGDSDRECVAEFTQLRNLILTTTAGIEE